MSQDQDATRRAAAALERALRSADPLDHPGYERLEALVDGRLDDVEREIVEGHLDGCAACVQDVADLRAIQADIRWGGKTAPKDDIRWGGTGGRAPALPWRAVAAAAGIAATIFLAVMVSRRGGTDVPPAPDTVAVETGGSVAEAVPPPAPDPLSAADRAFVDQAAADGRLNIPGDVLALAGRTGTLLGTGARADAPGRFAPSGTAVVETRPAFSWPAVPGAQAYSVTVVDQDFNEVTASGRVDGTAWTPGNDLPRGSTLTWQVTAYLDGREVIAPAPPAPEARFAVLDARAAATVDELRRRLAGDPLALGILLAREGAVDAAARQLERAAESPADADTARALLADLARQRATGPAPR
ncbi:MAG: zf-HC2 domain-containing protein [Vicinamibacterales bacterium]